MLIQMKLYIADSLFSYIGKTTVNHEINKMFRKVYTKETFARGNMNYFLTSF